MVKNLDNESKKKSYVISLRPVNDFFIACLGEILDDASCLNLAESSIEMLFQPDGDSQMNNNLSDVLNSLTRTGIDEDEGFDLICKGSAIAHDAIAFFLPNIDFVDGIFKENVTVKFRNDYDVIISIQTPTER
jgi:hypothetical protein